MPHRFGEPTQEEVPPILHGCSTSERYACACQASVVSKSRFAGVRPNADQNFGLDSSLLLANHH
eukprot:4551494-Amphidinium_carterae.1